MTFFVYAGAALAEIAGCFAFWAWLRLGKSPLWLVPGIGSLALFAYLLTLAPADAAGLAYAAYGGIYIVASILWLWIAEGGAARPVGHRRRRHLPCRRGAHLVRTARLRRDQLAGFIRRIRPLRESVRR